MSQHIIIKCYLSITVWVIEKKKKLLCVIIGNGASDSKVLSNYASLTQ